MVKFRPILDRIVVKVIEQTDTGIYIPEAKAGTVRAKVVRTGECFFSKDGEKIQIRQQGI